MSDVMRYIVVRMLTKKHVVILAGHMVTGDNE